MSSVDSLAPVSSPGAPRVAPGPKGRFIFGNLSEMRSDALGLLGRCARDFGDIVRLDFVIEVHLVNHPDHVRHVLQDRHTNYEKDVTYERMRPIVGDGLLTSNGDFWRRQRRLAQPAFHKQRLQGFATTMVAETRALLARWATLDDGATVDASAAMMQLTLGIVGRTLFSVDLTGEARNVGEALTTALEITNDRFSRLFVLPQSLPTPENFRLRRAVEILDGVVEGVITSRHASGEDTGDLLSMLMAARDADTGERMNDKQLRDEIMTMMLAGHETTGNLLGWTFYALSKNPLVARAVEAEVDAVLGEREPTVEDLPKLDYVRRTLEETMRLYPPAWLYSRRAIEEDAIGGYRIPKSSSVLVCPYTMHRHPTFWENPEGFDPDRFLPDAVAARPRFAYIPFAGGPRQCIGNAFAMMEAQLILAMVAQRYRMHLVASQDIHPVPSVTLRPNAGVRMTCHRRHAR